MRLLVVAPYFYPEGGGLETYLLNALEELTVLGYDITVVCMTCDNPGREAIGKINVVRIKPEIIFSNTPVSLKLYGTLRDMINQGVDVVWAHTPVPFAADVAALASSRGRIPFIISYHAGSLKKGRLFLDLLAGIYSNTLEVYTLSKAKRIIVNNTFVKEELSRRTERVILVPPGVDHKRFTPSKKSSKGGILFVGQLVKAHSWKGLGVLLEAMKDVIKEIPDVRLNVVGGGRKLPDYERLTEKLGIRENVNFAGKVEHGMMQIQYQDSRILVLSSTSDAEAFGMVLLEANSCGLPVIASKVGGIPYYVEDGENGLLFNQGDSDVLSRLMIKLLKDDRMYAKMRKSAVEKAGRYSWKETARQLDKVFMEVTS